VQPDVQRDNQHHVRLMSLNRIGRIAVLRVSLASSLRISSLLAEAHASHKLNIQMISSMPAYSLNDEGYIF
jgi:hypothetical protein